MSRFLWTDSHFSVLEIFSRLEDLIYLRSYWLQGSPQSIKKEKIALLLLLWQFSPQTSNQVPFFIISQN